MTTRYRSPSRPALVLAGSTYAEALAASQDWIAGSGALPIHAFDQAEMMLGAGTLGFELAGQAPDAACVLASVGGGGLLGGVAAWYAGRARVVGVEPEGAPSLTEALRAGRPVDAEAGSIAVDSLAPRRVGELTFAILTRYAAQAVLVDDDDIRRAQNLLWERLRLVAEPGGCAALAAVLRPLPARTWRDTGRGDQRREHDRRRLRSLTRHGGGFAVGRE